MESHPDNAIEDLHLDKPFPQLVKFSDSLDLNTMSKMVSLTIRFSLMPKCASLITEQCDIDIFSYFIILLAQFSNNLNVFILIFVGTLSYTICNFTFEIS